MRSIVLTLGIAAVGWILSALAVAALCVAARRGDAIDRRRCDEGSVSRLYARLGA